MSYLIKPERKLKGSLKSFLICILCSLGLKEKASSLKKEPAGIIQSHNQCSEAPEVASAAPAL